MVFISFLSKVILIVVFKANKYTTNDLESTLIFSSSSE
ncbi:hypothetical protein HERIO_2771 [Hepatospora eriocheir]|uniref:Uncharacterized protein n=1 Tax=Hepatospora eriocheir TaxID=1081669 RepID=A0A1X0Q994_9MICR|nr:hypothetical protein HERIO_2771 [Hepatospora eriocheir]